MEKVHESEYRFLEVLWEAEPVTSTELVQLCKDRMGWKKSTTYTVIRRLAEKGLLKHENTIVTSLASKEAVDRQDSEALLQRVSKGDVPMFLAAFLKDRKLRKEDVIRIQRLIEAVEEE